MNETQRKEMQNSLNSWAADLERGMQVFIPASSLRKIADALEEPVQQPSPTTPRSEPLTDKQIEAGREATFSTSNPFCPCDSKTMRKVVRWAEHAHGIGAKQ